MKVGTKFTRPELRSIQEAFERTCKDLVFK